jgi:hypothetical protein
VYVYTYVLEITMLCMCKTMCLKPIYECGQLSICATWCICEQCVTYLFVAQLLMVLHGRVFLFRGHSCCCRAIYMSCTQLKARISRKKIKKLKFRSFFYLRADQFTATSLPVLPTSNLFSSYTISKFKFVVVFDCFSDFRGNRSNRWREVLEVVSVFESLAETCLLPLMWVGDSTSPLEFTCIYMPLQLDKKIDFLPPHRSRLPFLPPQQ